MYRRGRYCSENRHGGKKFAIVALHRCRSSSSCPASTAPARASPRSSARCSGAVPARDHAAIRPICPWAMRSSKSLVRQALPRGERYVLLAESFSGPHRNPPRGRSAARPRRRDSVRHVREKSLSVAAAACVALAVHVPFKSLPRWLRAPLLWGSGDPRRAPPRARARERGGGPAVIRRRLHEVLTVDVQRVSRRSSTAHTRPARRPATASCRAPRRGCSCSAHARAQVAEIEGPHLLLQSRPAESAAAVLRFLRRWN